MAGYRVKYTHATKLVNDIVEAADELVLSEPSPDAAAPTCS